MSTDTIATTAVATIRAEVAGVASAYRTIDNALPAIVGAVGDLTSRQFTALAKLIESDMVADATPADAPEGYVAKVDRRIMASLGMNSKTWQGIKRWLKACADLAGVTYDYTPGTCAGDGQVPSTREWS